MFLINLGANRDRLVDGVVGEDGRRKKSTKVHQRKDRQNKKATGQSYVTAKGEIIPSRSLKPPCKITCPKTCSVIFTQKDREALLKTFWEFPDIRKKEFILKHIIKDPKGRETVGENSRRKFTRAYFLPKESGECVLVCRYFFMATLCVKPKFLRYTENFSTPLNTASADKRGSKSSKNRTPPRSIKVVREYIESLPAVHGHYCRNKTDRKYLPESFENVANIHRMYKRFCTAKHYVPVSQYVFANIFKTEYNLGIHLPKKDKCSLCVKFEANPDPSEEQLAEKADHDAEKTAINDKYKKDQLESSKDKTFLTTSFDLEKVLTTPHGKSVLFFYARK